jgi:hypothetical protein
MMGTPRPGSERKALDVAIMHGCACSLGQQTCLPAGHCLSRARLRHLQESDWVVVTEDSVPVGLAAYKCADSDVRVVHELMLDSTLTGRDAARVTDALLAGLEIQAYDDRVRCLMFLLHCDVVITPFERRGYAAIITDAAGTWLQKKLDSLGWVGMRSEHPS